jgi:hypothetical protein
LRRYWNADDDVLKFLQTHTHELWATGIDAVPASETMSYPGLKAQRAALAGKGDEEEPYIYRFPDGNASIARMLVRKLIPGIAPGDTMDDIVLARFDYEQLDRPDQPVRIRLGSTVVEARNVAQGVEIAYVNGDKVFRHRAQLGTLAQAWRSLYRKSRRYVCRLPRFPGEHRRLPFLRRSVPTDLYSFDPHPDGRQSRTEHARTISRRPRTALRDEFCRLRT